MYKLSLALLFTSLATLAQAYDAPFRPPEVAAKKYLDLNGDRHGTGTNGIATLDWEKVHPNFSVPRVKLYSLPCLSFPYANLSLRQEPLHGLAEPMFRHRGFHSADGLEEHGALAELAGEGGGSHVEVMVATVTGDDFHALAIDF